MNLEQLRKRNADQVTVVDGFRIGKLNPVDGMEFSKRFSEIPEDAPFEQVAGAYAFLLSKCILSDEGRKELDSDEGRAEILQIDQETFVRLGEAANAFCLGESKKN